LYQRNPAGERGNDLRLVYIYGIAFDKLIQNNVCNAEKRGDFAGRQVDAWAKRC